MGLLHNISTSCTSESSPSFSKKKMIIDRYRRSRPAYSSSSSSPEVAKEKTANQKLFARECNDLKLQRNLNRSFDSNVLDSSNASDNSEPRLQNGRHFDPYDPDEDIIVSTEGVLHLKKPLINKKNEAIFYESRGRMEPMDWSVINDNKKTEYTKKKIDIPQSKTEKVITINEYSERKPEANPEFLNFEQNSTASKKTYEVRNNFVRIPMNLPISVLHRKIKSRPKDSLPVTPKIREAFKCLQSDVHLTDLIDRPINKSTALSSKESNLRTVPITAENADMSIFKQSEYYLNGSKDLCEFDSRDSLSTLGDQNWTDGETKKSIDKHEDKIFQCKKSSSKARGIDEYDDEMFNFTKPSSKPKFHDGHLKNNADSTNSALKTVSLKKEVHPVNEGLVTLSNSESPSPKAQLYFNKIKSIQQSKLNYSMDSDDISLGASTRQNDDSASKKSMVFNYEIFKNKLKNTSTVYSPVLTETHVIKEKIKQKDNENVDEKCLIKEMRTREFIMSNSNAFTEETNAVEISNIKIFPKAEPLLTAVSTRYFTKSLKKEEQKVDTKIKDTNKVVNFTKSLKKEEQKVDTQTKDTNEVVNFTKSLKKEEEVDIKTKDTNVVANFTKSLEKEEVDTKTKDTNKVANFTKSLEKEEQKVDTTTNDTNKVVNFTKSLKKDEEQEVDTKTKDTNEVTNKVVSVVSVTTNVLDTHKVKKLTAINPISSLSDNESNSSQDLYLSFENTSNDEVFAIMTKNNEENRIQSYQHVTPTIIDKSQGAASDKSSEDDSHTIFYSCKYDDDTKSSIVIEEIDDSKTFENKNPIIPTADDIEALYKDMIDSDEEFDIVNVDRFPPYASIFNKLMEVKEAQKAIATGVLDVDDPEFDSKVQAYTSYKNNNRAIGFDKSKSIESSLEISDNHYSSIDASVSSNVESDCKASTSGSSNSLLSEKDNIFENLKIDNSLLDNSVLGYNSNKPEPKKINTLPNNKDGSSNHIKKNALNKYRKDVKPKITEEVKKEEIQKSVQPQPNTISNSKQLSKRLQVLNEMKKRKGQLADNKR